MQVHTLDKTDIINELTIGSSINHAVQAGRRSDFSLLVAMFSEDVRDNTPVEKISAKADTESLLRARFHLAAPQALVSNEDSYPVSAMQSQAFHQGGILNTKLHHYLLPEALLYQTEDTGGLPEEVYHNLSGHERRKHAKKELPQSLPTDLYSQLLVASRKDQLNINV
ncbi:hypothetical protein M9194_14505 [Vibrio sp. S4M6]|uniref:VC2046/SO_2500 family protein n=1 Tax=Vibrio sinus TaxID=2946865 RepID=UPI00202A79E1|nr:VC2046/SO_2500 family protein [Vibrio sinus]MCL9782644.1 hypothetical protein [Vibrio sinus]